MSGSVKSKPGGKLGVGIGGLLDRKPPGME
jgi:hypothetical protein